MTTDEAIRYFGSRKKLAQVCDVWPTAIYSWGKYPPLGQQYLIQVKTNGELMAEPENESENADAK